MNKTEQGSHGIARRSIRWVALLMPLLLVGMLVGAQASVTSLAEAGAAVALPTPPVSGDRAAPSAAVIYTVDRCPPSYQTAAYQHGQVVYLHGTGFQPYEPIVWSIYGAPGSCDQETRVAHSRMTADWSGSFCIYCYTVATDDCGTYKLTVNNTYSTYYDVPFFAEATATATGTPTQTPTQTPTLQPTPYAFYGYVYEELEQETAALAAETKPLEGVEVQLYFGRGEDWSLVDTAETTASGWFGVSHVTDQEQPYFRIVEVDPAGYASVRAEPPPLYGRALDDNTIQMRMPYSGSAGVMYFYDRQADPTLTPTLTPTWTGTPPTSTPTPTDIPQDKILSVTLRQGLDGYTGVEDTYITSWFLRNNYARDTMMFIRSGDEMAPMLRFDLSFIPPNSRILEAKLGVYAFSAGPHSMQAAAWRVFRPWVVNEVNWLDAAQGSKWAQWGANELGSDRALFPDSSVTLADVGRWYEFDVVNMAQGWITSIGQNQGVILKGSGDISVQWKFYASEHWQAEYRPKLDLTYALGPATPTNTPTPRPTATPTNTPTASPTFIFPFSG